MVVRHSVIRLIATRRLAALLCLIVGLAAGDAVAGDGHFRREGWFRGGGMAEARAARQADRAQQRAARGQPTREGPVPRAPPPAPVAVPPPVEIPGPDRSAARPGRLTPDERRALRQQINEAGRDVYRPTRP